MSQQLGPKELLYKEVIDAEGQSLGKVVNLTQNGSGHFDVFGIEMNGDKHQIFLDIEDIEQVDKKVRIKKSANEL